MIKIIGTTHVISKEAIEGIIKDENPDVLGIELCETRFKVLTNQIKEVGREDKTLIGDITNSIKEKAEEQNLDYGSDMKTVMFYAINNQIPLELVDKNILEIQANMQKIPIEEQLHLQQELIKFQQEDITQKVDEEQVLINMKEKTPEMYKILIEDRNRVIVNKIREATKKYPDKKILIFLGKGHVKDIEYRLEGGIN